MNKNNDKRIEFETVSPESVGLSSIAIRKVLEKLESNQFPMHSILIAKGNKLCLSAYYAPYDAETIHRVYSCTKSFVSLAIGLLIDRHIISLSDRIVSYFPDKCPPVIPKELDELTIENMLRMSTCYSSTTYKIGADSSYIKSYQKDWVGSFFNSTPTHKSGDIFLYDTSSTHVLCALVERITGKDILQFLYSSFLSEIGCSDDMYMVKDPMGISSGGSGLLIRPIDLLRVIRFIANGGDGLLSKEYLDEATSKQIDNSCTSSLFSLDTRQGYGYQFWIMRENSFAMYGLGGQFAIFVPEKDISIVTTADTQGYPGGDSFLLDAIWEIVDSISFEQKEENKKEHDSLLKYIETLKLVHLKSFSPMAIAHPSAFHYSVEKNKNDLKCMDLEFKNDHGNISFIFDSRSYSIPFGYSENIISDSPFENGGIIASSSSAYENTLLIVVKLLSQELGSLNISIGFHKDGATIFMRLIGELSITGFSGLYNCVECD